MALLIDADLVAYGAVSACQHEVEFEPDNWQLSCDIGDARKAFNHTVENLLEMSGEKSYFLCFSDPASANFRKELDPTYKATRAARKPVGYKPFVKAIRADVGKKFAFAPRLEADDVMGIMMTRTPDKHVIWSRDKDMLQVPGRHLIEGKIIEVNQVDGDLFFLKQVLTGDQVDNYPGCKGIGPVKADRILQSAIDANAHLSGNAIACCWPAIVEAYKATDLTEDNALGQARLAFILRHDNYNKETGKVKLWKPN